MNASKKMSFICMKYDSKTDKVLQNEELSHENIHDLSLQHFNHRLIVDCPIKKDKYILNSFSFKSICLSMIFLSLLLISGIWLVNGTKNINFYGIEGMITLINKDLYVFTFVVMAHIVIFQEEQVKDTEQVR